MASSKQYTLTLKGGCSTAVNTARRRQRSHVDMSAATAVALSTKRERPPQVRRERSHKEAPTYVAMLCCCSYDGAVTLLGNFEDSTTIYIVQEMCGKVQHTADHQEASPVFPCHWLS
jgi:hypothetical protein